MPPKAKFTRQNVIDKAFEIVREEGLETLTARNLGARLGSSARPIFTVFQSMDEVAQGVISAAKALYTQYIDRGLASEPAFKGVGTQYILFAINEPELFRLLFMNENADADIGDVLPLIDENYEKIRASVRAYGIGDEAAEKLYRHLWVYTHGIATLCATHTCAFSAEQISEMESEVFLALLKKFKEN